MAQNGKIKLKKHNIYYRTSEVKSIIHTLKFILFYEMYMHLFIILKFIT